MKNEMNSPLYFEPSEAGKTLKEVGVDFLQVDKQKITSRWFHGAHDLDLFLWQDERGQIIKQQLSFCGQIVEWNILDGIKTGLVIEEEFASEKNEAPTREQIKFDVQPLPSALMLAKQVMLGVDLLEENLKRLVISNFEPRKAKKTIIERLIKLFAKR